MSPLLSALTAVAAAGLFAGAVVLQHRSAHHSAARHSVGFLLHLAARPGWVAGLLVAAGPPGMYIAEPLVAILFGAIAFGETPSSAPALVALQVVGLVVLSAGIVYLARATPQARLVERLVG